MAAHEYEGYVLHETGDWTTVHRPGDQLPIAGFREFRAAKLWVDLLREGQRVAREFAAREARNG